MDAFFRLLRLLTLGGAFSLMGLAKLVGAPWEKRWFARWGEDDHVRRRMGAAETLGAALLVSPDTRRLGALTLAATSVPTLTWEAERGDEALAVIRFGLLVLAIGALTGRNR
jgi:hypothetical protein